MGIAHQISHILFSVAIKNQYQGRCPPIALLSPRARRTLREKFFLRFFRSKKLSILPEMMIHVVWFGIFTAGNAKCLLSFRHRQTSCRCHPASDIGRQGSSLFIMESVGNAHHPAKQKKNQMKSELFLTFDCDHGRIETRRYLMTSDIDRLQGRCARGFVCFTCVGLPVFQEIFLDGIGVGC